MDGGMPWTKTASVKCRMETRQGLGGDAVVVVVSDGGAAESQGIIPFART